MKHIETQVDLPAVPAVVWAQLMDTASMETWNPFITSLKGVLAVGERLEVRIAPVGGRPMTFKPRVTVLEPEQRLEWLGTMGVPGLFDGRHSFTLTPLNEGRTRFVQAGTFPAPSSRWPEMLPDRPGSRMNAALLARLERDATESKAAPAL